jgi:hypothetical protein
MIGFIHSAFGQVWQFGYNYSLPKEDMATNIKQIHSFNMSLSFPIPKTTLYLGLEGNFGGYAKQVSRQEYTFPDEPTRTAPVDVSVYNRVNSLLLFSQFEFTKKGMIRPYINLSGGRMWYTTKLTIDDIDPDYYCDVYLERTTLLTDGSTVGKLGLGFRFDLSYIFKKGVFIDNWYLDLGAFYTSGTRNVRYMSTYAPPPHQHHNPQPTAPQLVEMNFINTQTQIVHKHHVGYVYESPIKLLDFRVRSVFSLGGLERYHKGKRKNPYKSNYVKFKRYKR